jgi:1-deoxy-D-xylulose-5-phosphate synthase
MVVMAPKDGSELRCMLKTALSHNGPVAIRYPRGSVAAAEEETELSIIPIGKAEVLKEGKDILIVAIGNTVIPALAASQNMAKTGVDACVVNARFVKPIDVALISKLAKEIKNVLTVEENTVQGGFGSAVTEDLIKFDYDLKIRMLGLRDKPIEQGPQGILRKNLGIDAEGIEREAWALINKAGRPANYTDDPLKTVN